MISFNLPQRTQKPRKCGLTNLVDNGHGLNELEDKLLLGSEYIDIIKLGWASAHITKFLSEKVALFDRFNIQTCLGGMTFELSWWQNKIDEYIALVNANGIKLVEVSNGSLPISENEKRDMISRFSDEGFIVLSEVGSKDVNVESSPEEWVDCVHQDLARGAWKVILEGRADASAGIYTSSGALRSEVIETILDSGIPHEKLIFEAPHKRQMAWFVENVGTNVNIGNVPLGEVLNLETLRLGLRGDTVQHFHTENREPLD